MVKAKDLPITAYANTLGEVLTGGAFRVPVFQRQYAWTQEEVEELWEDLTTEVLSGADGPSFHFFGTVLTAESHDSASPKDSRLELLDGQQRLATFTLLLISIDRELEELAESPDSSPRVRRSAEETRELISNVIYSSPSKGTRRLELRPEEDALLSNILAGNPPGSSRLGDAFRVLHAAVRSYCEVSQDLATDLARLVHAILDRSMVIHARCIHGFDYFAVFSTLNARGLPLTAAQILRARSLGLVAGMSNAVEEATKGAWDRVEGLKEDGDRFLQYYMIMREGSRIQAKSVVRNFGLVLRQTRDQDRPEEGFANLAVQLDDLAQLYGTIRQGTWPAGAPNVSDWRKHRLRLLVRELGVKQALPLIMATAYRTSSALQETTDVIERPAFVALLCFPNQTRWGDFLFERANKVFLGGMDIDELKRDLREFFIQQLGNPGKRLAEVLPIQLRFSGRRKTQVRYFLTTINDYGYPRPGRGPGKPDEQAEWNLGRIHIDHISARALADGINADEKDRLGNLTPLYGPTNSSLSNQAFSTKRDGYRESPLRMTRELSELSDWNPSRLKEREKAIVDFAVELYCRDIVI